LELLVSAGQFAPAASVSTLAAAPDGRDLAFIVLVPDPEGRSVFHSLWILSIDSGDLEQVPIEAGYRVTDLWWTAAGLVWRGVDRNLPIPEHGTPVSVVEPFILGRYDQTSGASTVVFQSALAD
jgi:hypothetical protein